MVVQVDIAPACNGSSLGSNPDITLKYKMGDISKRVAIALLAAKRNIQKKPAIKVPKSIENHRCIT